MTSNLPQSVRKMLETYGKKQGWTAEQIDNVDEQFFYYSQLRFNSATTRQINKEFKMVDACIREDA